MGNAAIIPKRCTNEDAGCDLSVAEEVIILVKGRSFVKAGISLATPHKCYGRIAPSPGLYCRSAR